MTRARRLLFGLCVLLAACDGLPGRPQRADRWVRPDQIDDWNRLWSDNCAGCHGRDAGGGAALALANPVYLAIADDATIRRITAGGVADTAMAAFAQHAGGTLTDAQIDVLVSGLRARARPEALGGLAPPPYSADSPGNAARGAQVFALACASCHGADGTGGPHDGSKTGSIVDGSFLALTSDQGLRTTVIAGRPELGHPDWRGTAGHPLTSQDVTDVVAWLVSRRPVFPGRIYADRGRNDG